LSDESHQLNPRVQRTLPTVPHERWVKNVVDALSAIGDLKHQESRWLAPDRQDWENPDKLVNTLDDIQFTLFLDDCAFSLSEDQLALGHRFAMQLQQYLSESPQTIGIESTLHNPKWHAMATAARDLAATLKDRQPESR